LVAVAVVRFGPAELANAIVGTGVVTDALVADCRAHLTLAQTDAMPMQRYLRDPLEDL
jgi:hypothetical protein